MMNARHSQPGLSDSIAFVGLLALVMLFVTASVQPLSLNPAVPACVEAAQGPD